ncbi:MAG: ATP-binding protein [Candidatus Cloacimonetes bacterium]|nr:ATP-binding protein [Candidatus Cloacimonadota bacterium]
MLICESTRRQIREMKLNDMIDIVERQESMTEFMSMPFIERLDFVIQALYESKQQEKIVRLRHRARLKFPNANINAIYYQDRGLDRNQILNLTSGAFLGEHNCVLFKGPTGSGKTFLACAMANAAAISRGIRALYVRLPDLAQIISNRSVERKKLLRKYSVPSVLIIDEWLTNEINKDAMEFMLDLMDLRNESSSTIFCSLYPSSEWPARLGNCVLGESILDRIVHGMETVFCGNLNMREVQKRGSLRELH